MARPYICRECGTSYSRRKHNVCPNCGVEDTPVGKVEKKIQSRRIQSTAYDADVTFDGKIYQVRFDPHQYVNTWIHCPNEDCEKAIFQSGMLSGSLSQDCPYCGAKICFRFGGE